MKVEDKSAFGVEIAERLKKAREMRAEADAMARDVYSFLESTGMSKLSEDEFFQVDGLKLDVAVAAYIHGGRIDFEALISNLKAAYYNSFEQADTPE